MARAASSSRSSSTGPAQTIEYQRPWLAAYQLEALFGPERYAVVEGSTKCGKAQPLDALIYTPAGPVRMGDLRIGDMVCTPEGASRVVAIHPQGVREILKITFADRSVVEADADHLWEVHGFGRKSVVVTTEQLQGWSVSKRHRSWVPAIAPAAFHEVNVPLDPYLVGALIGDGALKGHTVRFSSEDEEILGYVADAMPCGYSLLHESRHDWRLTAGLSGAATLREAGEHIKNVLRDLGLSVGSHDKHVPAIYRYNSEAVRWNVLRGVFDTDGSVNYRGQPVLEQTSERLAKDVEEIVQSLGGSVLTHLKAISGYKDKDGRFVSCKPVWRQVVRHPDARMFFRLNRKRSKCSSKLKTGNRMFRSIEFSRYAEAQCIEIADSRHLYLTNGFIPTHNTAPCLIWLAEKAMAGKVGQNFWWVAPVYPQAEIAYRRMKRGLPRGLQRTNDTDRWIELANGTRIWFKSAEKPDNLYGEDVYAAVIDEASRCREESWHALRSTLTATRGPVRIIGNVKGRKNWAYLLARKAEAGEPGMTYRRITAFDAIQAGIISQDEVQQAKRDLPEPVFRELYLAEPSDDGGNPFGLAAIRACIAPLSTKPPRAWGWDLAKSVDWTVGIALDGDGHACNVQRFQKPWSETLTTIIDATGATRALVDATGVGDPIVERLQREGGRNFEGFKFSAMSKQQIMEGLAVAIQQQRVTFPDGPVVNELENFEYEYTRTGVRYSAPQGLHDDCVVALALAVSKLMAPRFEVRVVAPIFLGAGA